MAHITPPSSSGSSGDSSWTAPILTNSWANYGSGLPDAGYRKDGAGFVHFQGLVKSGSNNAAIFTLPSGYRPAANLIVYSGGNQGGTEQLVRLNIGTDGTVKVDSHTNVSDYVSLHVPSFIGT